MSIANKVFNGEDALREYKIDFLQRLVSLGCEIEHEKALAIVDDCLLNFKNLTEDDSKIITKKFELDNYSYFIKYKYNTFISWYYTFTDDNRFDLHYFDFNDNQKHEFFIKGYSHRNKENLQLMLESGISHINWNF